MESDPTDWVASNHNSINCIGEEEKMYGVKSTDYVDLTPFQSDNIFDEKFDEAARFASSGDWKENYYAVDTLRKINKFSHETFELRWMEVFEFIETCIHSPRTYLGKNVLILIQEVYMQPRGEGLINFTSKIVPLIEIKTSHESSFISKESHFALQFLWASMPYPEVIEAIWEGCSSKSVDVNNTTWKALIISLQNLERGYFAYPQKCKILFETITNALTVSKSIDAKAAIKILKIIGKESSIAICKEVFWESEVHKSNRILLVFEQKKKKKATSGGFRNFMKKMKKDTEGTGSVGLKGVGW